MTQNSWETLQKGDVIDVIAPGYGAASSIIEKVRHYLTEKGFVPRIPDDLLGNDPLCSNNARIRLNHLTDALTNTESKAIWCLKGGYGATQLMEELPKINQPVKQKIFIGFSDNTALHSFLNQQWGWHSLHAPVLWQIVKNQIDTESEQKLWDVLIGKNTTQKFELRSLNDVPHPPITSRITGGNLMLVQSSIHTSWHIHTRGKILFLEEIDETAYRIDRMLVHLSQTPLLKEAEAVIFGDFTGEKVKDQAELTHYTLQRCAESLSIPVFKLDGVGHDVVHHPLPLNCTTTITTNNHASLMEVNNHG